MHILIIQQKMIGDVLSTSLLCEYLTNWNLSVEIDFIANRNTVPVLKNNPFISNIIVFQDNFKKDKKVFWNFLKKQKKKEYDIIIDVYGKPESILITLFTPAIKKISYYKWYSKWVYTHTVERSKIENKMIPFSMIHRNQLIEPIVGNKFKFDQKPKLYLNQMELKKAKKKLAHRNFDIKLIMIAAIGSEEKKTYPLEKLAEIINHLCNSNKAEFLLNYIPNQQDQIERLFSLLNNKTKKKLILKTSPTNLRDFIGLLSQCDAIVGNEGGAINMGKALNIPSFAIFSPLIEKNDWSSESKKHIAIHLNDFYPEYFIKKINKKDVPRLYNKLEFSLFKKSFQIFINNLF